MRINSKQNISGSQQAKKTAQKAGQGFALPDTEDKSMGSTSAPGVNSVAGVEALLALQTVDAIDPRAKRRQAVSHGLDVLDILERLKTSLLTGHISKDQLIALKRLLEHRPEYYDDLVLKDILDHIDLRAKVELAKLKLL